MTSAKEYPSLNSTLFFVCDDIREEKGNRLSLMGFSPFPLLQVPKDQVTQASAFSGLSFLFIFYDGIGKFDVSLSLQDPNGKLIADHFRMPSSEKLPEGPMCIISHIRPFPVLIGTYKVTLHLDGKDGMSYSKELEIGELD